MTTTLDRHDAVLVLARGASRRMGSPKGACVAADDPRPLLARILDLYADRGWPCLVVTSYAAEAVYRDASVGRHVRWLVTDDSGGTARTVLKGAASQGETPTHLWLHPVDLPRVASTTLDALLESSIATPGDVIVPTCDGLPGHPVVLPTRPDPDPWPDDHPGDMRDLLHAGPWRRRLVPVDDPGVTDDIDVPDDLLPDDASGEDAS